MWTLGFDSTAATVTAALLRDGEVHALYSAVSATSHSTTLLPAIENLLSAAGITVRDLSLICCSAGPGSFTGVRIGVATAKGLAAPFGIPCVGVSSLEAMAYMYTSLSCVVCPVLGARRGNVYTAVFYSDGNGNITRLTDDELVSLAELDSFVRSAVVGRENATLFITGDSISEAAASLKDLEVVRLADTPPLLSSPNGYGAASCGEKFFRDSGCNAEAFSGERLVPIYLRKSQAEREKEEKSGN